MEEKLTSLKSIEPRNENLSASDLRKYIFGLKDKVWDVEVENFQYIIFYHRENQWWHAGDSSMLIYYYRMVGCIDSKKPVIRQDNDFCKKKWKYGYITIGKIDKIVGLLQSINCKLIVDSAEIKILKIPKAVSAEDMEVYKNAEKNKHERFNSLVVPVNKYPKVLSQAAALQREIVNKAVNLNEARRRYYGDEGVELISWIARNSIAMANGRLDLKEFFVIAIEKTNQINDWLAYVKKFNMFNIDTDIRIAQMNLTLKSLLIKELKKLNKQSGGEC